MNYKNLAKISCKIISIYVFIKFISFIPTTIFMFKLNNNRSILPILTSAILYFMLSILLWSFADKLSYYMVGNKHKEVEHKRVEIDYNKLHYIAFSVVGLVMIAFSISNVITDIIQMYKMAESNPNLNLYKAEIIGELFKLLIGLWLLLGAKGIVNGIKALRKA
ncbi:hypothetical protein [Thermohalobacter berrensis]|uniref:Uncharacterized protein n=1 Tax=Thermohalobacter berrensis TaxID=99594 RepID=A0A419SZ57_9FIRM|nr:hypothetical protein [Thermohalobacter berrensis]RKD30534.1 hypothetical protein BET03_04135 [Thermohalobacter berrensis]